MSITGTQINYFFLCHTKLWLFSYGITMEQESDLVFEGRLIHETTYPQRSEKYEEISIGSIKVDYYDPKRKVIHEVKKSDKMEPAHEWQLKYYIYVMEQYGMEGVTGILEYPKMRQTTEVLLSDRDRVELEEIIGKVNGIIGSGGCPQPVKKKICRQCSYNDFCHAEEMDEEM
jgi:CRISPR-associated exonuclease Cas4